MAIHCSREVGRAAGVLAGLSIMALRLVGGLRVSFGGSRPPVRAPKCSLGCDGGPCERGCEGR